ADMKDADVAAEPRPEAKVLEAGADVPGNRDSGLDREKIGREKLRLYIGSGKGQLDGVIEVAAGDEHLDSFPLSRAQWNDAADYGSEFGQRFGPRAYRNQQPRGDRESPQHAPQNINHETSQGRAGHGSEQELQSELHLPRSARGS